MQAVVVEEFGGPEVLATAEVPDPAAGPGEAVVTVAAAHVLWVETRIRSGVGREYWDVTPPYVPGSGVAGRVESVGRDVDPALLGARVIARTGRSRDGYAERVVVGADSQVSIPDPVSFQQAAALVHDGVTGGALVEGLGVGAADRVLVVGASGGLGIVLVQLARARGARVVALARDERKLARVRELGADAVVDAEAPGWPDRARTALGGAADVVFDNVGGDLGETAFALLAPGGRFSAHGTPSGRFAQIDPEAAARHGVTLRGIRDVQLTPDERRRLAEQALAVAADGRLRPVIGQTFPLGQAGRAHAAVENRSVFGSTLLTVGGRARQPGAGPVHASAGR
jgi:NADPH2:quinone reductase